MYSNQCYTVRWGGCYSERFFVTNGVPQGRILSPSLFNLYMNDLSVILNSSRIGCHINNTLINHLFYADDAVLLATSPLALQMLLDICSKYADEYELNFNIKKTKCLIFKPLCFKNCSFPNFYVLGKKICITNQIKYLGCVITDDYSDCKDMTRML